VFPLDVQALSKSSVSAFEKLPFWLVAPAEYNQIGEDIFSVWKETLSQCAPLESNLRIALDLIEAEVVGRTYKLLTIALEADRARQLEIDLEVPVEQNSLFKNFVSAPSTTQSDLTTQFDFPNGPSSVWKHILKDGVFRLRGVGLGSTNAILKFSENMLLGEAAEAVMAKRIWPEIFTARSSEILHQELSGKEYAEIFSDRLTNISQELKSASPDIEGMVKTTLTQLLERWIALALRDLLKIKKVSPNAFKEKLISGTPKYTGRLLGYVYHHLGKEVIRFEHGGERAFFRDKGWFASELRFCTEYRCLGKGGARQFADRYETPYGRGAHDQVPKFIAQGSRYHQSLFFKSHRSSAPPPYILYLPGLYLGERFRAAAIQFKLNDVVYVNWQIWLLQCLNRAGFKVILKHHPGGLSPLSSFLTCFAHDQWKDRYDARRARGMLHLFDFPGTAFIDAIAAGAPTILIDTKVRERDSRTFEDLMQRVSVVEAFYTEENLLRVDEEDLIAAIGYASTKVSMTSGFNEKYFSA